MSRRAHLAWLRIALPLVLCGGPLRAGAETPPTETGQTVPRAPTSPEPAASEPAAPEPGAAASGPTGSQPPDVAEPASLATPPVVTPPVVAPPVVAPSVVAPSVVAPSVVASAVVEPQVVERTWRPRLSLAAGMGVTFDAAGFPGGTHTIPAFFAVGGFGDGLGGFDLGAFSSSASGRFHGMDNGVSDNPVDRLALDAFGVVRPMARLAPGDHRYRMRVVRAMAGELGLGLERDGRATGSGSRFELHTGARVELPLTRAGEASELRLRLAVRRAFGLFKPNLYGASASDVTSVRDTTEVYAALAVVF